MCAIFFADTQYYRLFTKLSTLKKRNVSVSSLFFCNLFVWWRLKVKTLKLSGQSVPICFGGKFFPNLFCKGKCVEVYIVLGRPVWQFTGADTLSNIQVVFSSTNFLCCFKKKLPSSMELRKLEPLERRQDPDRKCNPTFYLFPNSFYQQKKTTEHYTITGIHVFLQQCLPVLG